MPSNGGGISQAIISGCFAAESILEHLEDGTPLQGYEERVRASMGRALKNSLRSKNMGYAFLRGDIMTEIVLRCLGPIGESNVPWNVTDPFGSFRTPRRQIQSGDVRSIGWFK